MKYSDNNIIGDSGEHLVASRIIKLFGFPCRLTNIDIGIDAEIEIIDKNSNSTGQFIKCQIKSTRNKKFNWYIDKIHIEYWNKLKIPVIIFLVHIKTDKIYWHIIEEANNYVETKSKYKIDFDSKHILKKSNKKKFIEISLHKTHKKIEEIINDAKQTIKKDQNLIETDKWDITSLIEFVYNANKIEYKLDQIQKWITKEPELAQHFTEYNSDIMFINEHLKWIEENKITASVDHGEDIFHQQTAEANDWD
jgi:arsenate reductase-like glutaredoxin family protein